MRAEPSSETRQRKLVHAGRIRPTRCSTHRHVGPLVHSDEVAEMERFGFYGWGLCTACGLLCRNSEVTGRAA